MLAVKLIFSNFLCFNFFLHSVELFSVWYLVGDWMSAINRRPTYIHMVISRVYFALYVLDFCLFVSFHSIRFAVSYGVAYFVFASVSLSVLYIRCCSVALRACCLVFFPFYSLSLSLNVIKLFIYSYTVSRIRECVSARVLMALFVYFAHISFISIRISAQQNLS